MEFTEPFLQLADAVIITDANHVILKVNKAYEAITGFTSQAVIGHPARILKSGLTPERTYSAMKEALRSQQPWSGVLVNKKRNGALWHSSISITPYSNNGNVYFIGIFRELEQLQQGYYINEQRIEKIQRSLFRVLAISCEIRDPGIEEHLIRVQELTTQLIHAYNQRLDTKLPDDYVRYVIHSSILHDIGKSGIPEGILYKPGSLADYERMIIEHHPQIGADILKKISTGFSDDLLQFEFQIAHNIIISHHERWDGSGYPFQLKGTDIPLEARIVSIVDVYDALVNRRPYKNTWPKEEALRYIEAQKGSYFDPELVDIFVELMRDEQPAT